MPHELGAPFSLEDLRKIESLILPSIRDAASDVPGGVVIVDILDLIIKSPGILEEVLALLHAKHAMPPQLGRSIEVP